MARIIKRFNPHRSRYERKTERAHGQEIVKPLKFKDFEEMVRICTTKRDSAKKGSPKYYQWYRNYIILLVGTNTGNRIVTICEQIARDYAGGEYTVTEHKTGKRFQVTLNKEVYREIEKYIKTFKFQNNEFIFRTKQNIDRPIDRTTAWRMIKTLAKAAGVKYMVGPHSLRKSFGRWEYDRSHDIFLVQKLLQHTSAEVTQRYIGLEDSKVQQARERVNNLSKYR